MSSFELRNLDIKGISTVPHGFLKATWPKVAASGDSAVAGARAVSGDSAVAAEHRSVDTQQRRNNAYRADKADGSGPRAAQARTTTGWARTWREVSAEAGGCGISSARVMASVASITPIMSNGSSAALGSARFVPRPQRPSVHPEADPDRPRTMRAAPSCAFQIRMHRPCVPRAASFPTTGRRPAVRSAHRRRLVQPPAAGRRTGWTRQKFGAADQVFPRVTSPASSRPPATATSDELPARTGS